MNSTQIYFNSNGNYFIHIGYEPVGKNIVRLSNLSFLILLILVQHLVNLNSKYFQI